jgi:uncharacterized protein YraI
MPRRPLVATCGVLLLAACGLASAQNAFTSRPMNVRAGPDRDYPLVAQLGPGAPLDVEGCLSDWSWCDVSFDDSRGWVYAGGLSFVYQGERVPLYSYGPSLGLPIITFSLLSYWDDHYRGRPWYSRRDDWAHRRMPPHMRPPGRPHEGPPPRPEGRPPMSHERPSMAPGRPQMSHGRAPSAPPPMSRGREPMSHGGAPMSHGGPPGAGRPAARGEERGRAAAPHGNERGQSHGEHGNGGRHESPP